MKRVLAAVAGALVALLVVAELAAVPLAERAIRQALTRCAQVDDLAVEQVARPIVPRLLFGRARDVVVTGEGLQLGEVRIERARLEASRVILPWAIGSPDPGQARLDVELTEADVEALLTDRGPLGVELTLELTPDVATVGARFLPFEVDLELDAVDGVLRIRPVAGDADWWDRLGVSQDLVPPDEVTVRAVRVDNGRASGLVEVALPEPGDGDGTGGCPTMLDEEDRQ